MRTVDSPSSKEKTVNINCDAASTHSLTSSIDTVEESIITFHKTKNNYSDLSTIVDTSTVDYSELSKCGSKATKISVTWADVDEPAKFLQSCKMFLSPFENAAPPTHLRYFISAVLMLQCHVQWINFSLKKDHETRLIQRANTLPTFCQVLKCFTNAMDKISFLSTDMISNLSSIFTLNLSSEDITLLHEWNSIFEYSHNKYLPLIDINLLETVIEDIKCEGDEHGHDEFNIIDASIEKFTIPYSKEGCISTSVNDEYSSNHTSIIDLINGNSKTLMEQIIDKHPESSPDDDMSVSHLLWSSNIEPNYKPLLTDRRFQRTTSSKKKSPMPTNKLNNTHVLKDMSKLKIDVIDSKSISKINVPNKSPMNSSSRPTSKANNFARLYSQLKTNTRGSNRSISSRSQKSTNNIKSSIVSMNKQRASKKIEITSMISKHAMQSENLIPAYSATSDAPRQISQKDRRQQYNVDQSSDEIIKRSKPKLVVSHIPHEILPKGNASRPA